ncbi:MAG: FtsQ-type POTRA domain-containing protein [Gammaproteobacteria bacterium]|nr:FtsQ-type POTRA domain-containing protein [Gammaproteobacteria bacterium]
MFVKASSQAVQIREEKSFRLSWPWIRRAALAVSLIGVLSGLIIKANDPRTLPVRKIHAVGTFVHVNEQMLRDAVAGSIDGGYFGMDMIKMQRAVEAIAWVDKANLRRVWPDTLAIEVQEQTAIARWAKGGLVNQRGVVFYPDKSTYPANLPLFTGPDTEEQHLTEIFQIAQKIFSTLALNIVELTLDARRALSLKFDNGIEVIIGREQIQSRLERLAHIYAKTLAEHAGEIARIDLRYSNGMAIAWRKTAPR